MLKKILNRLFKRKRKNITKASVHGIESNYKEKIGENVEIEAGTNNDIPKVYKEKLSEGVLPGEIILLYWLSKNAPYNFPRFFIFEYDIDPQKSMIELEDKEMIQQASSSKKLPLIRVKELKEILKENKLKQTGRKNDLIKRIINNLSENSYSKYTIFPSYTLTNKGEDTLKQNDLLVLAHNKKLISDELSMVNLIKSIGKKNKKDILHELYKTVKNKISNGNFNNVFNNLRDLQNIEKDESKVINITLLMSIIELSGMFDSTYNVETGNIQFDDELIIFPEGKQLQQLFKKNNISHDEQFRLISNSYDKTIDLLPSVKFFSSKDEYLQLIQYGFFNKNDEKFNKYKRYLYDKLPNKNKGRITIN